MWVRDTPRVKGSTITGVIIHDKCDKGGRFRVGKRWQRRDGSTRRIHPCTPIPSTWNIQYPAILWQQRNLKDNTGIGDQYSRGVPDWIREKRGEAAKVTLSKTFGYSSGILPQIHKDKCTDTSHRRPDAYQRSDSSSRQFHLPEVPI